MLRSRAPLWVIVGMVSLLSVAAASPAQAQARAGVQGGVSLDPDQVYFGGHVETGPLVDRVRFRPNIEVGLGDDLTLIGFNFEFTYAFSDNRPWNLYVGAGPAITWVDNGDSDTEGGFNFLLGAKQREGMFFEMKIGMGGTPDLKFGVGFTFR